MKGNSKAGASESIFKRISLFFYFFHRRNSNKFRETVMVADVSEKPLNLTEKNRKNLKKRKIEVSKEMKPLIPKKKRKKKRSDI